MARRRNPLEATNKAMQRGFSGVASTLAISLRLTEGRSSNRIIYAAHRDPWKKRKVALVRFAGITTTGYVPLKSSILHAWVPLSGQKKGIRFETDPRFPIVSDIVRV